MNIAFFSGKSFLEYLEIYDQYVNIMKENPTSLLSILYKDWASRIYIRDFAYFIINI